MITKSKGDLISAGMFIMFRKSHIVAFHIAKSAYLMETALRIFRTLFIGFLFVENS
jgi:hypothetical protein